MVQWLEDEPKRYFICMNANKLEKIINGVDIRRLYENNKVRLNPLIDDGLIERNGKHYRLTGLGSLEVNKALRYHAYLIQQSVENMVYFYMDKLTELGNTGDSNMFDSNTRQDLRNHGLIDFNRVAISPSNITSEWYLTDKCKYHLRVIKGK